MLNEWNPCPKPTRVDKKLKPYMKKRPKKTKKTNPLKQEIYKGRTIPTKQQRGKITTAQYNEAARQHGEFCFFCGATHSLECHHVMPKGFSRNKSGKGVWRNLRFLCASCHRGEDGVHQNKDKMEQLQAEHERLYGQWFWCDVYDLYKLNLIPNTTKEAYEKYFEERMS
ncbi:HNH endonuclease signature motif containing protein [Priestia flexa]|uniref:HNH endonuclease signature motif containing protein n=1 Tax=Priestia flexa TaxID=86664 RepID=UPI003D2CA408